MQGMNCTKNNPIIQLCINPKEDALGDLNRDEQLQQSGTNIEND